MDEEIKQLKKNINSLMYAFEVIGATNTEAMNEIGKKIAELKDQLMIKEEEDTKRKVGQALTTKIKHHISEAFENMKDQEYSFTDSTHYSIQSIAGLMNSFNNTDKMGEIIPAKNIKIGDIILANNKLQRVHSIDFVHYYHDVENIDYVKLGFDFRKNPDKVFGVDDLVTRVFEKH